MIPFGAHLRALRLARGVRQADLAARVEARMMAQGRRGFDVTYLSKIEGGVLPPPSIPALLALADELGTDGYELIALAGKVPPAVAALLLGSPGARTFFCETAALGLSEQDWQALAAEALKRATERGRACRGA